ncbi:MAG: CYTH domain-containing protein [Gammaproteobacteria bacterium]
MGTEIERKYLLKTDGWREQAGKPVPFRQGYLVGTEKSSVRIRIEGDKAFINIKSATLGITRQEYQYQIPVSDAQKDHTWEIDEFYGDNEGLIVAEIELKSEDETFEIPPWIGDEVSDDTRYYNVCLVKHPYKDWS